MGFTMFMNLPNVHKSVMIIKKMRIYQNSHHAAQRRIIKLDIFILGLMLTSSPVTKNPHKGEIESGCGKTMKQSLRLSQNSRRGLQFNSVRDKFKSLAG